MNYPKDTTKPFNTAYKYSQASLWGLSEVTCIFLVFCVPALSKLFEGQTNSSWVTASWRSWMRMSRQPARKGATYAHWPSSTGNHSDLQCRTGSLDQVEACEPSMQHSTHGDNQFLPGSDSFKTVALDIGDDVSSKPSIDSKVESQEQWIAPHV